MIKNVRSGGGTETYVLTLALSLKKEGYDVGIYTSGGSWLELFRQKGIRVHVVSSYKDSKGFLKRVLRYYQIVHANDQSSIYLLETLRPLPRPVIVSIHGSYFKPRAVRKANAIAKAVIAVSPPVYKYIVRCGATPAKVHFIPNGVSVETFRLKGTKSYRMKYNFPRDAFVIGYAGRFTGGKRRVSRRISRVIRSYQSRRPDIRVMVAGRNAKTYVKESSRCVVAGLVMDMSDFYRSCDLIVGTGRVALEAIACGKPVLAIGYGGYVGPVTLKKFDYAWRSHFGDHEDTRVKWTDRQFTNDLNKMIGWVKSGKLHTDQIRKRMVRQFSSRIMINKIDRLYEKATR